MNSIPAFMAAHIAMAFLAGGLAAHIFCRVLWQEVEALTNARALGLRMLVGTLLRTVLTAACLVLAGGGEWAPTVAALAGFALMRTLAARRIARAPS